MKLPALDKQAHFLGGWALSATVFIATAGYLPVFVALTVALLATLFAGWAKEHLVDLRSPATHTYDMADMYWTWAGCLPVAVVVLVRVALAWWFQN